MAVKHCVYTGYGGAQRTSRCGQPGHSRPRGDSRDRGQKKAEITATARLHCLFFVLLALMLYYAVEPDATQSSATTAVPEVQASANESAVTLTLAPGHVSATPGHEQAPPTSQQTVIDGGTNALFSFPTVTGILATGSIASKPPLYPVAFPPAKEGTKKKVRSKPRS